MLQVGPFDYGQKVQARTASPANSLALIEIGEANLSPHRDARTSIERRTLRRSLVKPGTISVERIAPNQATADKSLLLMPGTFPNGIEAADPMLALRNAAYPVSFSERQ